MDGSLDVHGLRNVHLIKTVHRLTRRQRVGIFLRSDEGAHSAEILQIDFLCPSVSAVACALVQHVELQLHLSAGQQCVAGVIDGEVGGYEIGCGSTQYGKCGRLRGLRGHVGSGAAGEHDVGQLHGQFRVGLRIGGHADGEADDETAVAAQRTVLHRHHHDGVLGVGEFAERQCVAVASFVDKNHVAAALLVRQRDVELHAHDIIVVVEIDGHVGLLAGGLCEVGHAQ